MKWTIIVFISYINSCRCSAGAGTVCIWLFSTAEQQQPNSNIWRKKNEVKYKNKNHTNTRHTAELLCCWCNCRYRHHCKRTRRACVFCAAHTRFAFYNWMIWRYFPEIKSNGITPSSHEYYLVWHIECSLAFLCCTRASYRHPGIMPVYV